MPINLTNWIRYRPRAARSVAPSRRSLAIEALDERCLLSADPVGPLLETAASQPVSLASGLEVSVVGPSVVARGEPVTFTFITSGSALPHLLHYVIDWDGDGNNDAVELNQNPAVSLSHAYSDNGSYLMRVWVGDPYSGLTAEATYVVDVNSWRLAPNTSVPGLTDLVIGGSTDDDFLIIFPASSLEPSVTPDVIALSNIAEPSGIEVAFGVTGSIIVHAQGGNDMVFADLSTYGFPSLVQSVSLYGGAGDDFLVGSVNGDLLDGGGGNDILIGGLATTDVGDFLIGGAGNDIIIGGTGADYLVGGSGRDLLITGFVNTSLHSWSAMLLEVRSDWVAFGVSGVEDGGNLVIGETVLDDAHIDLLDGGEDQDWFIRDWGEDVILDVNTSLDVITDI